MERTRDICYVCEGEGFTIQGDCLNCDTKGYVSDLEDMLEHQGQLRNKRIQLICKYKNGQLGTVMMECIDKENDRPYMYVLLDEGSSHEVFWYGEIMFANEEQ